MEVLVLGGLAVIAVVGIVYLFRFFLGTHKIVDIYDKIEKIEHKIVDIHDKIEKIENEMICPLCLGKGFVDYQDLFRFHKLNDWKPGFCKFCDANGKVVKGITKTTNPMEIRQ